MNHSWDMDMRGGNEELMRRGSPRAHPIALWTWNSLLPEVPREYRGIVYFGRNHFICGDTKGLQIPRVDGASPQTKKRMALPWHTPPLLKSLHLSGSRQRHDLLSSPAPLAVHIRINRGGGGGNPSLIADWPPSDNRAKLFQGSEGLGITFGR